MEQTNIQSAPGEARRRGLRALVACLAWLAAGMAPPVAAQPPTTQVSGYVTVATDARSRGLSQQYDEPAVRLGLDYQRPDGFFAGGVLGNVNYDSDKLAPEPRDKLVELYAGYLVRGPSWGLTTAVGHYAYPGATFDYDYTEVSAAVDFRDRYFYRLTYTDDLQSLGYAATAHELGATLALPADFELGAALGLVRTRGNDRLDYTHYNVGISKLVGPFGLDLRRYETSRRIESFAGSSVANRWVLSLSYALRPRR